MPDSLVTCLPCLVKPPGSFSKTEACITFFYTTNKLPSSLQLFVYLSIHVTFHFSLLFSAVFLPDPLVSLERCMWISGSLLIFFFPANMPQFFDWPMKFSLKLPCIFLNISGNIKVHILQGVRAQLAATAMQASALIFPFPSSLGALFICSTAKREE